MNTNKLYKLLNHIVRNGVEKVLDDHIAFSDTISVTEAYRIHGRGIVQRWIREGIITPVCPPENRKPKVFNRQTLEKIAFSSNRATYLPVAER